MRFGDFQAVNGSLIVNGSASVGRAAHLTGQERWALGADGLIVKSDGHFDSDEYRRQLDGESSPS